MSKWSIKDCQDILECAIGEVNYQIPEDVIGQTIDYLEELKHTRREFLKLKAMRDYERDCALWEKFPDGFY